jgi:hypothetical protein
MKFLPLATMTLTCLAVAFAQNAPTPPKRIYIEQYLRSGAIATVNCSSPGNCVGTGSGLERNISLEATKGFTKNCPVVTVTDNRDAADYLLKINLGSSTLYSKNGDVAYISPARVRVANLVKDVCNYVKDH